MNEDLENENKGSENFDQWYEYYRDEYLPKLRKEDARITWWCLKQRVLKILNEEYFNKGKDSYISIRAIPRINNL